MSKGNNININPQNAPSQWAEIIGEIVEKLSGTNMSTTINFDQLEVDVPRAKGPDGRDLGRICYISYCQCLVDWHAQITVEYIIGIGVTRCCHYLFSGGLRLIAAACVSGSILCQVSFGQQFFFFGSQQVKETTAGRPSHVLEPVHELTNRQTS
jgi:hypothetical protein